MYTVYFICKYLQRIEQYIAYLYYKVTPFSAHCIFDHRISDQKVRTVMVRAIVRVRVRVRVRVWVRVRLGDAVVRNAVGRKVGNRICTAPFYDRLALIELHCLVGLNSGWP